MTRRTTRRGSQRRGLATIMLVTLGVFGLTFVGSIMGTAGGMFAAYTYFASDLPDPNILDGIEPAESTYVYDRSGRTLLTRFECQNREAVDFEDLPEVIWQATVASEDRTFWENNGVDFQGTVRAALANLEAGRIVQGASTITQQVIDYARVLKAEGESTQVDAGASPAASIEAVDPDEPASEGQAGEADPDVCQPPAPNQSTAFEDKIRENILAMEVTAAYPGEAGKQRILETYLNLIFYGNGSYGIKAAAANYFGVTDLESMTVAQAAFLAALPQQPSFLDPYQNPRGEPGSEEAAADAIRERNLVLGAMLEEGYITRAEYQQARATLWLEMEPQRLTSILLEPHFAFRVRGEAERILGSLPGVTDGELAVRTGGYTIITTLDYELQRQAHELVKKWVATFADKNVNNGAMVAIDSATGEIVAYIGSVDYYNREDPRVRGQFDIAGLSVRQPGSAFKPITYASAFQSRDATVATMFVDAITEFGLGSGSYRPTNADIREHGPLLAVDALRYSLNIPSVQMQYLVGAQTTAEFAEKLGIASAEYIMGEDPGLTLTLGSVPVNLTNMTQAYGTFAQQGELNPATTIIEIRDRNNRVVYTREDNAPEPTRPMTPAEAYLPHWILESNTDPARNVLWGRNSQLLNPDGQRRAAGFKTGTTNDFRDLSAFGYVPDSLVTGVWMGNNNGDSMSNALGQGLFSADGPGYLWQEFMQLALNNPWEWNGQQPVPLTTIEQPDGIVNAAVCRWSGMSPTAACGRTITVPFLEGTVPPFDNVSSAGCLNLEAYVSQATPDRPQNWVAAASTWADRLVNGETGARGNPLDYQRNRNVRFAISPVPGESGFPSVCGELRATPTPSPTPDDDEGGRGRPGRPPEPTPEPTPGEA
ncbi:MAG TPA: transglycosylase domain-containing protein [Methylomirabilota bacterium]|nr:transglycosylase domain-containing protein [Methylomirabilota bacterium]